MRRILKRLWLILAVTALAAVAVFAGCDGEDELTEALNAAYERGRAKTVLLSADNTDYYRVTYKNSHFKPHITGGMYSPYFASEQLDALQRNTSVIPVSDTNHEFCGGSEFLSEYGGQDLLISRIVELDPVTGETDALLTPDPRLTTECRLPQSYDEIAITDYQADMFIRYGYKYGYIKEQINSPDDLIGKTINLLTICGVYSTEEDKDTDAGNSGEHIMKYAFVAKGFNEHYYADDYGKRQVSNVLYKLSGDISTDKAVLGELTYEKTVEKEEDRKVTLQIIYFSVKVRTR